MAENPIQESDPPFDLSLRPPGFEEFHGQEKVTERLMLMVEAVEADEAAEAAHGTQINMTYVPLLASWLISNAVLPLRRLKTNFQTKYTI